MNKGNMKKPLLLYETLTDYTWGNSKGIENNESKVKQIPTYVVHEVTTYKTWEGNYNSNWVKEGRTEKQDNGEICAKV